VRRGALLVSLGLSACDERPVGSVSEPLPAGAAVIESGAALRLEGERAIVLTVGDVVRATQVIEALAAPVTLRLPGGAALQCSSDARFELGPVTGHASAAGRLVSGTARALRGGAVILTRRGPERLSPGGDLAEPSPRP
jgi:hypothetical protein